MQGSVSIFILIIYHFFQVHDQKLAKCRLLCCTFHFQLQGEEYFGHFCQVFLQDPDSAVATSELYQHGLHKKQNGVGKSHSYPFQWCRKHIFQVVIQHLQDILKMPHNEEEACLLHPLNGSLKTAILAEFLDFFFLFGQFLLICPIR